MGQYYNVVIEDKDGNLTAYDRTVDGEYTMAKLMEHSWWYNPFVSTITKMLHKNPMRVAWVGDYADDCVDAYRIGEIFAKAWTSEDAIGVNADELQLDGKYLVNHDNHTYVDCTKYRERCENKKYPNWIIHPIPLLTAVGNGLGGGDYSGIDEREVGLWYLSLISVEDEPPVDYEEYNPTFKEKFNNW